MGSVGRFRNLPLPPQIIVLGVVIVVASVATGFALDANSFALHMLSELAGIVGGILLGALYVDALLERERKKRWREVSASTAETLRFATVKATQSIYLLLPTPRNPDADPFVANEAGHLSVGLRRLESALGDNAFVVTGLGVNAPAALATFEPRLRVIREVILPRMLAVGVVPKLVSALLAVESAQEMLDYNVSMDETFGTPASLLVEDLKRVVGSLAALAEELDASLDGPS